MRLSSVRRPPAMLIQTCSRKPAHVSYVYLVLCVLSIAMANKAGKQNVTISISADVVQKARILAARRSTSISGLLAEQIELLTGEEEEWERSERSALALMEQGFHLGGRDLVSRDELHER